MIHKPSDLTLDDQKFSMLIYGPPGVGKTTLAASAPKPLLIDLDKGLQRVRAHHRIPYIDPATYETLLEDIASPADLAEFDTLILDTGGAFITLLQDYVMRKDPVNKTKSGTISQKGFGAVKAEFTQFMNKLKTIYRKNVIYVFHSIEEKNKDGNPVQRLLCEGSAKNIVWQPCDFGAYLFKNGDRTYAGFTPTDEYFAKGCYGINGVREIPFGDNVKNDYLTRLFEEAKANVTADNEFFKAEKDDYERVTEEGRKMIEAVITPDQAAEFSAKVKDLKHSLTSFEELRTLFKERLEFIGVAWNREAKRYEYKQTAEAARSDNAGPAAPHAESHDAPVAPQTVTPVKESVPTGNAAQTATAPAHAPAAPEAPVSGKEQVSIEDFIAADSRKKEGKK